MRGAGYQPAPDLKTYFNNQPKKIIWPLEHSAVQPY